MSILTDELAASLTARGATVLPAINPADDPVIRGVHTLGSFEVRPPLGDQRFADLTPEQLDDILDAIYARLDVMARRSHRTASQTGPVRDGEETSC